MAGMSGSDEELAAFWAARLAEAEAAARHIEGSAGLGCWDVQPRYQAGAALIDARTGLLAEFPDRHTPEHIALHDPARVLREVAAGRKILAEMRTGDGNPWSPGYRSPDFYAGLGFAIDALAGACKDVDE